jgi:membrane associated rhomboid family serine protease
MAELAVPSPARTTLTLSHTLLALAVMVVWGTNFVVIRAGLQHLPPLLFATLRFTLVVFLACGILGNLGYALLNFGSEMPAVGASGAVAGMMGAASRLMGRPGDLAPFRSRIVIGMALTWLLVNLVYGLVLVGWMPGSGGAPIAWQVHLAGYAAGLFLLSPALALIGRLKLDHGIEN